MTPEETIDGRDPRAGAEVGRDVGRGREAAVHAAEAAGAHEADPDRGAAASVPPTVVAPTAPCDGADGEVARAELARVRREALELRPVEPDHDPAVEDADRRGHGARRPHGRLAREADLDAVGRREAVRDERRLERDDRALLGERGRTSSVTRIRCSTAGR